MALLFQQPKKLKLCFLLEAAPSLVCVGAFVSFDSASVPVDSAVAVVVAA